VVDLAGWVASLDAVVELIAGRFGRVEPRRRVGAYLRGLLAGLERKNGWTLAEHAGAVSLMMVTELFEAPVTDRCVRSRAAVNEW
jgi:hypothetical protein